MRDHYRWAAAAGAVVLMLSGAATAWADEVNQNQAAAENVTMVSPNPGGQGEEGGEAQAGEEAGYQPQNENKSTVQVIRAGEGNSPGNAPEQSSSFAAGSGASGVDYSLGPGAVSQPSQTLQPQNGEIQIYEVENPVVQAVDKYSYDQMVQDINALKERYGQHMQVNAIGSSLDGRVLYDCIVGNPSASRHILIQAGIHGREYMNPLLLMQQMEMALANYDTGSFHGNSLADMFSQAAVHFVPMTNPDGISISQFGLDGLQSQELKDAVGQCYGTDSIMGRGGDPGAYLNKWKANARGVDLNLNFDAQWEAVYSTAAPSYSGYKGTAPGSEPESQALIGLYQSAYPWKAVINYHSMGNVIYWDIPGNKVQQQSAELANLMSQITGGYRLLPSEGGGGYKDWIQLTGSPVPSVTLETGSVSCPLPLSEYASVWGRNRLTWIYAMEWVLGR